MKKLRIGIALVIVMIVFVVAADSYLFKRRPKNVPVEAVFGNDKGNHIWIACESGGAGQPNHCTFYAPRNGEVIKTDSFVLEGTLAGLPKDQLSIVSFDYETITTTRGVLVKLHDQVLH